MPVVRSIPVHQAQLDKEIKKAIRKVGKDVVRVNYTIREDSTGDPAIFFRVLLTDAASREGGLVAVTRRISTTLIDQIRSQENWGLLTYFNYRSQSEQEQMKDPEWA